MLRLTLLHQEMLMMWMEKAVLLVAVSLAGCAGSLDRKTCGCRFWALMPLACKPSYSGAQALAWLVNSDRRLTQRVARLPHSNEMFT